MSRKLFAVAIAVVVLSAMAVPAVFAQSATNQTWVSSITYYTPSDIGGTLVISFYAEGSATPITLPGVTLQPHKAGSLYIGGVSALPSPFRGTAVLSSDVYVVATAVQIAGEAGNYPRPLYTGFTETDAASQVYIASILNKKFGSTTTLAIQNTESFAVTANVKIYPVGSTTPYEKNFNIQPQSDVVLLGGGNLGGMNLPADFTGSAVITGAKTGELGTPGNLVAVAQETDDAGRSAKAFEGLANGANTVYMASMLCRAGGVDPQISYYAIQNTSLTNTANVTIDFYNTSGVKIASMPSKPVVPGGKTSENPCAYGVPDGTSGSAVITSVGAPIIAMGKVSSAGGIATAFLGQAAGSDTIAAPYIRWSADPATDYRTFVAVMNVGGAPATNVVAKYYDGNGTLKATHPLATAGSPLGQFIKTNTSALAAGALTGGQFGFSPSGGSVEITSDQPLVVVVRASKSVSPPLGSTIYFAEDYNGVAIP